MNFDDSIWSGFCALTIWPAVVPDAGAVAAGVFVEVLGCVVLCANAPPIMRPLIAVVIINFFNMGNLLEKFGNGMARRRATRSEG
jgi:hypothetical protein